MDEGVLQPDDRVELLDGSSSPCRRRIRPTRGTPRRTAAPDEIVTLVALPDVRVPVAAILPPDDARDEPPDA